MDASPAKDSYEYATKLLKRIEDNGDNQTFYTLHKGLLKPLLEEYLDYWREKQDEYLEFLASK